LKELEANIAINKQQAEEESKLLANAKSGDSALEVARKELAVGNIAGANAASEAASSFYAAAGKYGEMKRADVVELDRMIMQAGVIFVVKFVHARNSRRAKQA
jgi:hypothetical protein